MLIRWYVRSVDNTLWRLDDSCATNVKERTCTNMGWKIIHVLLEISDTVSYN